MTKVSHVVVDGSNIATEGRSTPSLAQLEDAVNELRNDLPEAIVIVVVDATFAHRIDESERERFEQALLRREYVSPPAGAIGRGDAFLLRIAERVDGTVLSNDSFQEFHGEHSWLFDTGRLLGATPVLGVGWIFVPRSPVRGPKSHVAVRDARKAQTKVEKAIAAATKEAVAPTSASGKGAEPRAVKPALRAARPAIGATKAAPEPAAAARRPPQAVNDPLTFIEFVASHPLGVTVSGVAEAFTSHGAVVMVGDVRCYVPLSGLSEPAPRSAREILHKNEPRDFVVTALDPQRRGVELALPEVAVVSGKPSPETVEADVALAKPRTRRASTPRAAAEPAAPATRRSSSRSCRPAAVEAPAAPAAPPPPPPPSPRRAASKKVSAAPPAKAAPAKKAAAPTAKAAPAAPARRGSTSKKSAPVPAAETVAVARRRGDSGARVVAEKASAKKVAKAATGDGAVTRKRTAKAATPAKAAAPSTSRVTAATSATARKRRGQA